MAKLVLMLALCVLPAIVIASRPVSDVEYHLIGRVYCDTCRAGFETPATRYIAGAEVKVQCKERKNTKVVTYEAFGVTDATGTYNICVKGDHGDGLCEVMLVSSPLKACKTADPGRDRSRVTLTSYNGIVSNKRFANAMGFMQDEIMSGCTQLLQQYQEFDD